MTDRSDAAGTVDLPPGLVAYRRSPTFDEHTLPAALQKQHRTKAGAWALIHVIEGQVLYRILEPPGETVLTQDRHGVVQPGQPHELQLIGPVRLFVEFFARDAGDRRVADDWSR
jgi:tellurite resistance-related uncharacterized protein